MCVCFVWVLTKDLSFDESKRERVFEKALKKMLCWLIP